MQCANVDPTMSFISTGYVRFDRYIGSTLTQHWMIDTCAIATKYRISEIGQNLNSSNFEHIMPTPTVNQQTDALSTMGQHMDNDWALATCSLNRSSGFWNKTKHVILLRIVLVRIVSTCITWPLFCKQYHTQLNKLYNDYQHCKIYICGVATIYLHAFIIDLVTGLAVKC